MSEWWKRPAFLLMLIGLLTIVLYASSIHNPFFMDDFHTSVENPNIQTLANIPAFFVNPDYFSVFGHRHRQYRPMVLTSFALNYYWGGTHPEGYRALNLLLHLMGIWMVYILIRKLFMSESLALVSAALFGLHPFQAEVVNYISARSSSMATLFYVSTVYLFLVFRQNQENEKGMLRTTGLYLLFLVSFCLALLSKEISLTLPAVLILVDLLLIRPKGTRDFLVKGVAYLPFILVAMVFALRINLVKFLVDVHFAHPAAQVQVLFKTPWLLLFPTGLSADHPISSTTSFSQPVVLIPFLLLMAFLILGIVMAVSERQIQRNVAFLIFWFFITSLPTTLFPLNQAFVEHRGYLPSVGLIPLLAMIVYRIWNWGERYSQYRLKEAFSILFLVVILIYGSEVQKRNKAWSDQMSLWTDTVMKYPESKLGQLFLAVAYQSNGKRDQAHELFQKIVADDPECQHHFSCSKAHLNLGMFSEEAGKWDDAIQEYQKTLQLVPDSYWVRYRLGVVYQKKGDLTTAMRFYQESLEHQPTAHEVHYALGTVYETQQQYDLAREQYETALKRVPGLHAARTRLAEVLVHKGLLEQAAHEYETVLTAEPQNGLAHRGLGYVYESQGHLDQAMQHYQSAVTTGSDDPALRFHLGSLYLKAGNRESARKQWESALSQAPDFLEARLNLAMLLQQDGRRDEAISQYRQLKAMVPAGKQYQDLSREVEARLRRLEKSH